MNLARLKTGDCFITGNNNILFAAKSGYYNLITGDEYLINNGDLPVFKIDLKIILKE